jgi:uncharacterized protein YjbI with pentapeptide repeats
MADQAAVKKAKSGEFGLELGGADLSEANLEKANLSEADLSGAVIFGVDLSWTDISGAIYDEMTRWPKAFNPETAGAVGKSG